MVNEVLERGASWRKEQPELGPYIVQAALVLMSVENASLAEATLAGLDAYREPWELLAAPEVAA